MTKTSSDQATRQRALNINHSFIVQAPAGSGKTSLLTQRFLSLLATVQQPEEIVAITFTRKAAKEMRDRILAALRAGQAERPQAPYQQVLWQLARKALAQDKRHDWRLLDNPNRLRLQTIDAFCGYLIAQRPLAAGTGGKLTILEDATPYYLKTVRDLLNTLDDQATLGPALTQLLQHVDNRQDRAEHLLTNMLANRSAWLPVIGINTEAHQLRSQLEQGLASIISDELQHLKTLFPRESLTELLRLANFAGTTLDETVLSSSTQFKFKLDELALWRKLCKLLLTQDGHWRKTVTRQQGFPAPSSSRCPQQKAHYQQMKQTMQALLASLQEQSLLREQLQLVRNLPQAHYNEDEWQLLQHLLQLLPNLVAQLMVNFQEHGVIDHSEVTMRALQALGGDDDPTKLALVLDYRLQHLLVDEFQDTSVLHFQLLEKLTRSWTPGDGHTLFLVGDPMQSIYRFRKAEVSLFLQAKHYGLGDIHLEMLELSCNFRSQKELVTWHNHCYQNIFPSENNFIHGAIRYHPAIGERDCGEASIHYYNTLSDEQEAEQIIDIIQNTESKLSIGILVRARSHLQVLLPKLRQAEIHYHALALDTMIDKPHIKDLLSLTQALLHPANRLAWLSVLRAPFVGLSLADLHTIAYKQQSTGLWARLCTYAELSLSKDGMQRCCRIVPCLAQSLQQRGRLPLAQWVENTWLALGGPACLQSKQAFSDVEHFFTLLQQQNIADDIANWEVLYQNLACRATDTHPDQSCRVDIMTIHKAKGLEFDVVILPCLAKSTRQQEPPLLLWSETTSQQKPHLLLAPLRTSLQKSDSIYHYLQHLEKQKDELEQARLLYVATSRAKQKLHLLGQPPTSKETAAMICPSKQSFLYLLWPYVQTTSPAESQQTEEHSNEATSVARPIYRLATTWQLPKHLQDHSLHLTSPHNPAQAYDMSPSDPVYTAIGILTHELLKDIANQGIAAWPATRLTNYYHSLTFRLQQLGVASAQQQMALTRIQQAIEYSLTDKIGRWILSPHASAQSEYAISGVLDQKITHVVIDRTFIDDSDERWIIDYKTSFEVNPHQDYLQQQIQQYRPQMQRYARIMALTENRHCHLGLYFPLMHYWYVE